MQSRYVLVYIESQRLTISVDGVYWLMNLLQADNNIGLVVFFAELTAGQRVIGQQIGSHESVLVTYRVAQIKIPHRTKCNFSITV